MADRNKSTPAGCSIEPVAAFVAGRVLRSHVALCRLAQEIPPVFNIGNLAAEIRISAKSCCLSGRFQLPIESLGDHVDQLLMDFEARLSSAV